LKSIFLPRAGLVLELVLSGSPLSWTITLEVSIAGPWLKESAFGFGPVVAGRLPTPKAIMLKAIEEDIRNTASIFFMVLIS
jgi:hypothetical protein